MSKPDFLKKGFSLLEISITLIALSIVMLFVISGKSIIESTNISGLISEWRWYQQSVKNFKDVYNYWPGDVPTSLQNGKIAKFTYQSAASTYSTTNINYLSSSYQGDGYVGPLDYNTINDTGSHNPLPEVLNAFRQIALFTSDENKLNLDVTTTISTFSSPITINNSRLGNFIPRTQYLKKQDPNEHWILASIGNGSSAAPISAGYGSQKLALNNFRSISLSLASLLSNGGSYYFPTTYASAVTTTVTNPAYDNIPSEDSFEEPLCTPYTGPFNTNSDLGSSVINFYTCFYSNQFVSNGTPTTTTNTTTTTSGGITTTTTTSGTVQVNTALQASCRVTCNANGNINYDRLDWINSQSTDYSDLTSSLLVSGCPANFFTYQRYTRLCTYTYYGPASVTTTTLDANSPFTSLNSTPSTLASKIDAKGDDGRPFSGQIGSIITNVLTDSEKYASTPTNAPNPCVNTLSSNAISDSTITSSVEYSTSSSGKCWLTFLLDSA